MMGMFLYQEKFVGKSHKKSDSGPIKAKTRLMASKILFTKVPSFGYFYAFQYTGKPEGKTTESYTKFS